MIVTSVQLRALKALDPTDQQSDPSHRPRNSLERLRKKGLVTGDKKVGWGLTTKGKAYLKSL